MKKFKRKVSIAIISTMLLSMLMPIMSYAAGVFVFYYTKDDGYVTGYIYSKDPDSVIVELQDVNGDIVTLDTYKDRYEYGYDDDNSLYYSVSYSVYVDKKFPSIIKVTTDNEEYQLDYKDYGRYYEYLHLDNDGVTFDAYRIPGEQFFTGKKAGAFLKKGDKLVSFTPATEGYRFINLALPYSYSTDARGSFNLNETTGSDFVLMDTANDKSIAIKEARANKYYDFENEQWIEHESVFMFELTEDLMKDVTYELSLSSTSGNNEIQLPSSAAEDFEASVRYGTLIIDTEYNYEFLSAKNVANYKNISFSNTPDPTPESTPTPTPAPPGGGLDIVDPNQGKQVVKDDELKNAKDGIVSVAVSDSKPEVLIPANAGEAVGNNTLRLENNELQIDIPANVLKELKALLPSDQLEGAQISFTYNKVTDTAAAGLLSNVNTLNGVDIESAGDIYDFSLSIIGKDGKVIPLTQFSEPLTINLKVNENANKDLLGIYYISDSGELEYVGGQLQDGYMQAEVSHFSKYAVLEYDKSYSDVHDNYWAASMIKSMSAKHIIQGRSADRFDPEADVTRAEFAAMLARALGLKSNSGSSFTDVSADSWYADAVAAASEAGIVQGKSNGLFAPDAKITREEMAALLVRAYELAKGEKLAEAEASDLADRGAAADWALGYIDTAYEAGLLSGRDGNQFAPKAHLTRAESAKVIYTLLAE